CSIALYVRGWLRRRRGHLLLAALCMGAGILVHYSAGPFAVFLGLHFVAVCILRKDARTFAWSAVIVAALLLSWFGWSMHAFGVRRTFLANSSVADRENLSKQQKISTIAQNLEATLVPHPLRISPDRFDATYAQLNTFGYVRDYAFTLYQTNLPLSLGLLGWLATVIIIFRTLRRVSPGVR